MLASQLNNLVLSGQLRENTIVQVEDFMNNQVQNRTVIILLRVTVTNQDYGQRIGQPVDIEKVGAAPAVTPAAAASAQPMYNRTNNNVQQQQQNRSNVVKPEGNHSSSGNPYGSNKGGSNGSSAILSKSC